MEGVHNFRSFAATQGWSRRIKLKDGSLITEERTEEEFVRNINSIGQYCASLSFLSNNSNNKFILSHVANFKGKNTNGSFNIKTQLKTVIVPLLPTWNSTSILSLAAQVVVYCP